MHCLQRPILNRLGLGLDQRYGFWPQRLHPRERIIRFCRLNNGPVDAKGNDLERGHQIPGFDPLQVGQCGQRQGFTSTVL